jgi:hypothetical protein
MVIRKTILIGWAALAIFATPAFAQQTENGRPAALGLGQTRKVLVWRGNIPPAAPSPRQTAEQNQQTSYRDPEEVSGQDAQDDQPGMGRYLDESTGNCPSCDCDNACQECCIPFWEHRTSFFGEFLYLRPTGIDMAHAFQSTTAGPLTGFAPGANPDGAVGVLNPVYTPAFRVGGAVALDSCSSVGASWARFQSHCENTVALPRGPGQPNDTNVTSLVLVANGNNIPPTASLATAGYDVDFQLFDVDYRRLLSGGFRHALNYTVGVRYGNLVQGFQQNTNFAQPLTPQQTNTNIRFEGAGLRTGLDGARQIGNSRLSFYGKSFISVLFGEVNASYTQTNILDQTVQATSRWADVRPIPILEYELGLNWTSRNGHWRMSGGYYTAFWFNAVTTGQYVQSVQTSNFVNVGQTVSFNGLVSRLEYAF